MNGKGDTPRPLSVDRDEFARRWDRAFSRTPAPPSVGPDDGRAGSNDEPVHGIVHMSGATHEGWRTRR